MLCSTTRIISVLCLCLLEAGLSAGADPEPIRLDPKGQLELDFEQITITSSNKVADFTAAVPDLSRKANWGIFRQGRSIPIRDLVLDVENLAVQLRFDTAELGASDPSDIPDGQVTVEYLPVRQVVNIPTGPKKPGPQRGWLDGCLAFGATADKKKADIDITGGVQAGINAKPQYFWSVKAQCGLLGSVERFGRIGPTFNGEASQQRNADPDSLKAAITWRKLHAYANRPTGWEFAADALRYEFERSLKKEAVLDATGKPINQAFLEKNSNLMWSGIARYVYAYPNVNFTLGVAGFEAGRTLSRTVKKASNSTEQQRVTRLLFDFDVYKDFFASTKRRRVATFHGNHTLRLPFVPEPYLEAGVNNDKMFLTNKPRHWTQVELAFLLSKGAAINIQYKRGSLPPTFEFVNHQVTVGFNLLLKAK